MKQIANRQIRNVILWIVGVPAVLLGGPYLYTCIVHAHLQHDAAVEIETVNRCIEETCKNKNHEVPPKGTAQAICEESCPGYKGLANIRLYRYEHGMDY